MTTTPADDTPSNEKEYGMNTTPANTISEIRDAMREAQQAISEMSVILGETNTWDLAQEPAPFLAKVEEAVAALRRIAPSVERFRQP